MEKKMAIKITSIAVAGLLLGGMIGGAIGYSVASDRSFEIGSAEMEQGGMLIDTENNGNGIALTSAVILAEDYDDYGISPLVETAYTVTASIQPAGSPDTQVDWSVAFDNPSSTWANGKDVEDYVTVSTASDGALTATISNLAAFGEQIILTCALRNDPSITAEATIDYARRLSAIQTSFTGTGGTLGFGDGMGGYGISGVNSTMGSSVRTISGTLTPTYATTYTVTDTFDYTITLTVNQQFLTSFKSYAEDSSRYTGTVKTWVDGIDTATSANITVSGTTVSGMPDLTDRYTLLYMLSSDGLSTTTARNNALALLMDYRANGESGNGWRYVQFDINYVAEGTYTTHTNGSAIGIGLGSGLLVGATSGISLNDTSFVF